MASGTVTARQKRRAFLVEDEPAIAELLQRALEKHGFEVVVHRNGSFDELVSACATEPHLLVCDLNLPRGSGADLCRMILERYPKCEVILMTGDVDAEDAVLVRGGFTIPVLLHKPFSLDDFVLLAVSLTAH